MTEVKIKKQRSKKVYTLKEASEYLLLDEGTFRIRLSEGRIEGKEEANKWGFSKVHLDEYRKLPRTEAEINEVIKNLMVKIQKRTAELQIKLDNLKQLKSIKE